MLNHDVIGSQWSHGVFFLLLLSGTLGAWVIDNRTLSQVQRKNSCSNNVAQELESVAKPGDRCVPISHNYLLKG